MKIVLILLIAFLWQPPLAEEKEGYVVVEAEDYHLQRNTKERFWTVVDSPASRFANDPDSMEYKTASGKAFLELLPDTRTNHDENLIRGINFCPQPGTSVLEYPIKFNTPGKYYVWVKAFSTNTEDNGIHVGLNGEWPESGQRMQWCEGKHQWTWASKQRTEANHCGEPQKIFLQIKEPGLHTIMFSMREDGFAFDKFALSQTYEVPAE